MLLIRGENRRIKTEWYMKPIASGRFLDFLSYHPMSMKINVAKNFIHRVNRLSTSQTNEEKAVIINNQLKLNHYPPHLRHRLINRMSEHHQLPSIESTVASIQEEQHSSQQQDSAIENPIAEEMPPTTAEQLEHTYRSMINIPHLSNRIERLLKKDYGDIRLAKRNVHTVNKIFSRIKDPIPIGQQTNVIYQIPCKDCSACYIGMTQNRLDTRMYGHKTHYNALDTLQQANTSLSDPRIAQLAEKTALLQHSIEQNHRFDLGKVAIVDKHDKQHALPLLEMCHITNSQHSINRRTDTDGLNAVYAGILHAIKNNTHTRGSNNVEGENQQ